MGFGPNRQDFEFSENVLETESGHSDFIWSKESFPHEKGKPDKNHKGLL